MSTFHCKQFHFEREARNKTTSLQVIRTAAANQLLLQDQSPCPEVLDNWNTAPQKQFILQHTIKDQT